jgi:hypothetical protein
MQCRGDRGVVSALRDFEMEIFDRFIWKGT